MTTGWNFGDVFDMVAGQVPDAPAQIHGDHTVTWSEFDRRTNAFARDLIEAGLGHQARVGSYLYNGTDYFETVIGAWKAALVPFNTNYRYGPAEVAYLFDDADAEAIVFHTSFTPVVDEARHSLPLVKRWYAIDDSGTGVPDWAVSYEQVISESTDHGPVEPPWGRHGDDLLMLYTGGTTGMPKGVMWRQDDLFTVLGRGGQPLLGIGPARNLDELAARTAANHTLLVACPMMHGTGLFGGLSIMQLGGAVAALPSRTFDPAELWRTVDQHGVTCMSIVGDAFARPMLAELDERRDDYDLSTLQLVMSSGVMWSQEVKDGLIGHLPQVTLADSFSSSEAVGLGASASSASGTESTARFRIGRRCKVFTEDGREVEPGSGEAGLVAVGGAIPLGYHKDPEKTAATFRVFNGERYSVPGDWATVETDGTLTLLGRGSVCINTGGEKVFPEEVEEVLKRHAAVRDAVCVGVPNERFGETICAVVEPHDGYTPVLDDLSQHVRSSLAAYKAPRHLLLVDSIGRAPNGKVDYKTLTRQARDSVLG